MDTYDLRYQGGDEIHAGDRVRHGGQLGTIVAVIGRGEYTQEFSREAWADYRTGFIIRDDTGVVYVYEEADEDLELLARSSPHGIERE